MPATLSYPGVYIEEVSSGVHTITGVATSITAFLGRAARGPINEPVTINSFADFERNFGGLQSEFLMSYAVRDFYMNGGSQAIIVRLTHPNFATDGEFGDALFAAQSVVTAAETANPPTPSATDAQSAANSTFNTINTSAASTDVEKNAAKTVNTAINNAVAAGAPLSDVQSALAAALAAVKSVADGATQSSGTTATAVAADAGTKNSPIQSDPSQPSNLKTAAQKTVDAINNAATPTATVSEVKSAATAALAAAQSVADAANGAGSAADAGTAATNASNNITGTSDTQNVAKAVAQVVADAVGAGATFNEVITAAKQALADAVPTKARLNLPTSGVDVLTLEAVNEGSWGNVLRARVDYDGVAQVGNRFAPLTSADLFNLTIHDMNSGTTEKFLCVSVKPGARAVDKMLENGSNLVSVVGTLPASVPKKTDDRTPAPSAADLKMVPFSITDSLVSGSDTQCIRSVAVAPADQGSDGAALDGNDFTGPLLQENKRGLYALEKADLFNLLCIPPQERGGDTDVGIYQDALPYCQQRRAMLIVDSPAAWSANPEQAAAKAKAGLPALNLFGEEARNAALFFPRVIQSDPLRDGQSDTFVPCGMIAGVMARTDTARGVWKAPAGIDASLNGIQGLELNLTDPENGMLNPLGINCLRFFQVAGRVVWGSRTLRGADQLADDYKYIPVRRLALYIEESLYRGTQWVVFEPNAEPLWAQIRLNGGSFMHSLFRQGAFQGQKASDAYFVKCSKETTTQDDINRGVVNIIVGFAPLKPAEFVVIQLTQIAGQIEA